MWPHGSPPLSCGRRGNDTLAHHHSPAAVRGFLHGVGTAHSRPHLSPTTGDTWGLCHAHTMHLGELDGPLTILGTLAAGFPLALLAEWAYHHTHKD